MRHTIANERKTKAGLGSKINNFDQTKIAHRHFLAGDISNKIPVPLSDGRTVVFAKSAEDVERVKAFWEEKIKQINP
jgi:hypothetical protein